MLKQMNKQDAIETLEIFRNDYTREDSALCRAINIAIDVLRQPTIEAEPVRHGRWIMLEPYGAHHTRRRKCSECGEIKAQELTNFCPNCGAQMDESIDNT